MPRINRRVRALKQRGLSETQRELLVHGVESLGRDEGFDSAKSELAAWREHRNELMAEESSPGRRPFAFFKHELGSKPRNWAEQIELLLKHGLIEAEEAVMIENQNPVLSATSAISSARGDEAMALNQSKHLDRYSLKRQVAEFTVAALWHTWRGRSELAARYTRRAELVSQLREQFDERKSENHG